MGLWLAKPYLEIRGKQHGLKAKYEFLTRCGLRLFSFGASVDILEMMKEYLDICEECPALVNPKVIFQHLKNMVVRNDKVCVLHSFSAPFPGRCGLFTHPRARHPGCQTFMHDASYCINIQDFRELFARQKWPTTVDQ